MPADVEEMVSVREVPWHGIGTIVQDVLESSEALKLGGLDWLVAKCAKEVIVDHSGMADGKYVEDIRKVHAPDDYSIVRMDNDLVLGAVGSRYTPVQNHESFAFFDALVRDGKAKYETAGSLDEGRTVFLTAKLPDTLQIGGTDPVEVYLVLSNAHDGSASLQAAVTPVRVVCRNTLNMALAGAQQKWSMRHTKSIDGKLEEARRSLELTFKYVGEFEKVGDKLISQKFTDAEFEKLIQQAFPEKDLEPGQKFSDRQAGMIQVFRTSDTVDDAFRNTKWGAINAIGEYFDWAKVTRSSEKRSKAEQRTAATLFGPNVAARNKALSLLVKA